MNNRNSTLDIIKGIGTLLVLILHCFAPPFPVMFFFLSISGGLMLAFFILSGYTYRPGKRTPIENICRRVLTLGKSFLQYMILALAIALIYYIPTGKMSAKEILKFFLSELTGAATSGSNWCGDIPMMVAPFWFVVQMIFASCLFFLLADRVLDSVKKTLTTAIFCILITAALIGLGITFPGFWHIEDTPAYVGYLLLGAQFKKWQVIEKMPSKKKIVIPLYLLSFLSLLVIYYAHNGCIYISTGNWGNWGFESVMISVPQTLLDLIFLYYTAELIARGKSLFRFFTWMGRNSLQYLMIQGSVLVIIHNLTGGLSLAIDGILAVNLKETLISFSSFVLTTAFSTLLVIVAEKVRNRSQKG